jgi:hypothetical protein
MSEERNPIDEVLEHVRELSSKVDIMIVKVFERINDMELKLMSKRSRPRQIKPVVQKEVSQPLASISETEEKNEEIEIKPVEKVVRRRKREPAKGYHQRKLTTKAPLPSVDIILDHD